MANETEIKIKITGEDDASPTLKTAIDKLNQSINVLTQTQLAAGNAAKQSKEDHEGLNTGLVNLSAAFHLVMSGAELAVHAFHAVEEQLHKAVEEALAAEKAQLQLVGALKSSGQYSDEAKEKIEEYVEGLERFNGANGETVKTMIAVGLQMNLSVKRAAEMEEAARKLAAVTGKDVNEAFAALKQAMNGHGRALAQLYPLTKEFGAAQLQNGAAIDFLNKKLADQYEAYQKSLPAALSRAEVAINNVYKAVGLIITQSSLVRSGVNLFTEVLIELEREIKVLDIWLTKNKESIEAFGMAFGAAVAIVGTSIVAYTAYTAVMGAVAAGTTLATLATSALGAALAFITSPITIAVAAVGALTLAFFKWEEVSNILVGSMKIMGSALMMLISGPVLLAIEAAGKLAGLFNNELGKSITDFSEKIFEQQKAWMGAGYAQLEYGAKSLVASKQAGASFAEINKTVTSAKAAHLDLNTVAKETSRIYAGINIGTDSERKALAAGVKDRDDDKKKFEDYLEAKKRLAISKEEEQQIELTKVQAGAMKGAGGSGEKEINANVAIDAETKKQAELDALYAKGLLNKQQYDEATLASDQRAAQAELDFKLASKQEMAELLGESEAGYAAKQAIEEERFQLKLQQMQERAQLENATALEIQQLKDDAEAAHRQEQLNAQDQHNNAVAAREEISGATVTATRNKWFREQEKAQADHIKKFLSGVMLMESIQTAMNQTFAQLGDALIKNQKITASKMVGVFLEMLGRQVQQKGFADLVMGIFPPNPVQLGVGAAEIAAGTAIGRLGVSMQGGQAHDGLDEVPSSMNNKSFVLAGGERVVSSNNNADLKDFLKREKDGTSSAGGNTYSITLNYSGAGGKEDAQKMGDMVIDYIRSESEKGRPIMSSRGLTSA